MDALSERCEQLAKPDIGNFSISIFILVGILVSYLPQHAKIVLRRSSEGLSPWFVLLGTTSGTCAIANILVLPRSREDIGCCDEIDGFACGAALLGIAQLWANILGIMATCLASIQYVPQIYTTWKLQHVYSLSIPMMLIQTPGSFVFAASLAVRLGASGWSAWGVYIVTGILQGVLLGMGIYFWVRDRKEQKARSLGSPGQANGASERTPLLHGNGEATRE
ncbi:hypothetical protein SLS58_009863 [Diplodia intermedia]|uniref:PQ loop repeat protein n=1 Tax=Diplodia intermedia TaxID=856260 RepID=A0ABR3TA02_9PEZI